MKLEDLGQTQTTTKDRNSKSILWFFSIICLLLVISHNFIEVTDDKLKSFRSDYNHLMDKKDVLYKELKQIKSSNDKKNLEKVLNDFIETQDLAYLEYQKLRNEKKRIKVFNFDSINTFLFQVSIFFVLFLVTFLFRFICINNTNIEPELKNTIRKVTMLFFFLSFYYLVWSFYYESDLPHYIHLAAVIIISTLFALATDKFIFYIENKKNVLIERLNNLELKLDNEKQKVVSLIDFILDIRNNYFKKLASKAMEVDEDETLDTVIDFEKKTEKELSKIV